MPRNLLPPLSLPRSLVMPPANPPPGNLHRNLTPVPPRILNRQHGTDNPPQPLQTLTPPPHQLLRLPPHDHLRNVYGGIGSRSTHDGTRAEKPHLRRTDPRRFALYGRSPLSRWTELVRMERAPSCARCPSYPQLSLGSRTPSAVVPVGRICITTTVDAQVCRGQWLYQSASRDEEGGVDKLRGLRGQASGLAVTTWIIAAR